MTDTVIHASAPDQGVWYVLRHRTTPDAVALMLADMAHEGYEAYIPQELSRRRVMRQRKLGTKREWVSEPLIRGYVFVRRTANQRRSAKPMTLVYGVEGTDALGAVTQPVIDRLRAAETEITIATDGVPRIMRGQVLTRADRAALGKASKVHLPPDEQRLALKPGEVVEFQLLDDFIAGVVQANHEGRLTLLAEYLGRSSRFVVELPTRVRLPEHRGALKKSA